MRTMLSLEALAIVLGLCGEASADPLDDAQAAIKREDFAAALSVVRPLAENGDAKAQRILGRMYENGQVGPVSYQEAFRWMRRAADQGDMEAEYETGKLYEEGVEGTSDFQESLKWFRKAAEQGHAEAQYHLGECYETGVCGAPKSEAESFRWFRSAAEQGHGRAAYQLAWYWYSGGVYVAKDDAAAVHWYRVAVENGDLGGLWGLARAYNTGTGVKRDKIRAHMWLNLASANNEADAISGESFLEKEPPSMQKLARSLRQATTSRLETAIHSLEAEMTKQEIQTAEAMAVKCQTSNYKNCD